MSEDSGLLTYLATTWPPRWGHRIARLLRITAAYRLFCPGECCPSCDIWGDDGEGR